MLTRRSLLEGAGATVALLAVGGVGVAFAAEEDPLRPPGAQDEQRFIATCVRCDRCRSVCPTRAIGVATVEEGLLNVRTPVMEFRLGYCDECGGEYRCVEACPAGSLLPFDKTREKIGVAVVRPEVCLTYGVSGSCSADCVTACPEDALRIDEGGRLVVDPDPCWGCGACEYYCVSDSYGIYEDTGTRGIAIVREA